MNRMRKLTSIIFAFALIMIIPTVIGQDINKTIVNLVNPSGDTDWWSMSRHDLSQKGLSLGQGPQTNNLNWSQKYQGVEGFLSGPIVVNNKIYVFPKVPNGVLPKYGVFCFNAIDGSLIWSDQDAAFGILGGIFSNNRIYSVGLNNALMGVILCHDAETGNLIWSYTLVASILSMPSFPVYYDGKIFFVWEDLTQGGYFMEHLRCLKDCGNFALKVWDTTLSPNIYSPDSYSGYAIPAIVNGNIYALTKHIIYKFNVETGSKYWEKYRSDLTYLSLAEQNDKIVFGEGSNVTYVDTNTGQVIWSRTLRSNVWAILNPAVTNDKIYVGFMTSDHSSYVSCLANTGDIMWTTYLEGSSSGNYNLTPPSVAGNKLYIGGGVPDINGKIYCLDTVTGDTLWSYSIDNAISGSLSIADNALYIGSRDGTLYKFKDINSNDAPDNPTIDGPMSGDVGTTYDYTFVTTDPNQDNVFYFIDWGDETNSGWIGPYQSGITLTRSHMWSKQGTYIIKAKAKDTNGMESDWGTLTVSMPLDQPQSNPSPTQYNVLRTLNMNAVVEMMSK